MPKLRTLLLVAGDALVLVASYFFAAAIILEGNFVPDLDLELYLAFERGWTKIGILTATLLFGFYFLGLYENVRVRSRRRLAEDLILVFGIAFLLQAMISYVARGVMMSRSIMLLGTAFALVLVVAWRSAYSKVLTGVIGRQKILFLGDTPLARKVIQHLEEHPEKGFESVGLLDPDPHAPQLEERVFAARPDRIAVAKQYPPDSRIYSSLLLCSMQRIKVENIGEIHENVYQQVALESITTDQLIFSPAFQAPFLTELLQTIYGIVFSVIGILLTWPFMILTAIAVKLDSPGPALLRQERVGLNGKHFFILKFRSMYVDADQRFGRTRAGHDDPRITRVGKFIRVTRLDELPQFFNILRREMNFVGPRPEMPSYVKELTEAIPLYPQRLRVKPGLTGWAQLHHVPEVSPAETARKLSYDLYYIKNMSILLDAVILFHTVKAVLFRTGAR